MSFKYGIYKAPIFYNRPSYDIQKTVIWEPIFHGEYECVKGKKGVT